MSEKNNSIQMFEDRQIRTAWNAEQEEWYFSVTDVIAVLTDSADPKQYIKKMRSRDPELDARWGTICTLTSMVQQWKEFFVLSNLSHLLRLSR